MDALNFIGRKEELSLLKDNLRNKAFSASLIYGRRRVGKTELIRQAIHGEEGRKILFVASKTTYETNFSALSALVAEAYQLPVSFPDLRSLLRFIGEQSEKEKTIFVLDEYSFFRDDAGLVDSIFQQFIDRYQHLSQLSLILSGSIVRIMKSLIDGRAPLFGRFETILALQPFDYQEASLFYPERTPEENWLSMGLSAGFPIIF